MPADASIYGMIQPHKQQGPLELYGQMAQVKNLMGAGQLQDLQRGELERGIAEEGKLRDLFSRGNVKVEDVMAISPKRGMEFQKSQLEQKEKQGIIDKNRAETLTKQVAYMRDRLAGVNDQAGYNQWLEEGARLFGPEAARSNPPQFTPEVKMALLTKADDLVERLFPKPPAGHTVRPDGSLSPADPEYVKGRATIMAAGQRPTWDSDRAIWITPPGATFASAPTPAGAPAVAPPAGQGAPQGPVAAPASAPAILPKAEMDRLAKEKERKVEVTRTLNTYVQARDGLLGGLSGATTGPVAGRIPAFTSDQQIADGAVSAMAPVLKQLFRSAGEGTFTEKDQELLLNMVPTRSDNPDARKAKMENIDRIVAAKLGMEVPAYKPKAPKAPSKAKAIDPSKLSDDELRRELGL